jgi:uncharacterized protein YdhG (YjbR/CyaY superfamily)
MAIKKKIAAKKAPTKKTVPVKKKGGTKQSDAEQVAEYMNKLEHPLKAAIEAVRDIIKKADKRINERIKWNAPSYYYKEDMVTFNPRATRHVHLVFHHPAIESIPSSILEGDYKGRRMTYFADMNEVKSKQKELVRVMGEIIKHIEK